CQQESNWPLTL
nr:immunoglobulin light chain junction region [Macaca mulatta]